MHFFGLFQKNLLLYLKKCKKSYNEDKLVLFSQKGESESLRAIRGILTVWHVLYAKNSKLCQFFDQPLWKGRCYFEVSLELQRQYCFNYYFYSPRYMEIMHKSDAFKRLLKLLSLLNKYPFHRRRIELEDKAKVVALDWGTESLLR